MVIVRKEEFPPVVEVRVLYIDKRIATVGKLRKELPLDGFELARFDLEPVISAGPREAKELLFSTKIRSKELIDKRHVVVERAHFEYFFAP